MNRVSVGVLLVAAAALVPLSAPAQAPGLKERMEELRKRREEKLREARERAAQNAAGGAPGQAGSAAQAQAGTPAQAGAATQAQGGAATQAQGGAAAQAKAGAAGAAQGGTDAKNAEAAPAPKALEALRESRAARRQNTLGRLRERWGPLLGDVRAREELRVHAQRVAQLQRLRAIAEEKKKVKQLEQIDALMTKEELRHSRAMNALRDGAPAPSPANP